jgi:uncharacterized lipoprotein YddW (UPF0748 family)
MKKLFLIVFFIAHFLLLFDPCSAQPKYEFRAVWIATVDNIDWPSKGNFNTDSQKVEFIRQLDMHRRNGINAVIVQVRPAADAFYPSEYEPWSQWLTGKQGQAPSKYYDPLQFMIEETHKRGMEFHAWCNPYRAVFQIGKSSIAETHVTKVHPDWFLDYGGVRYFDPGNKEVQNYVTTVIRDLVRRYDIDAIHFDDYFYPYRIPGREFPDDASFSKYGNGMDKGDWRRSNVDSIIVSLGKTIKEEKSHCKFGISPFGVWRNKSLDSLGSDTHAGQTNYDDLYADIVLWLKNGWIDYVAPQLYWEFGQRVVPFEVLLDWWAKHSYGRHCYIGLALYKAGSNPAWRERSQIPNQIRALREEPTVQGMVFFSSTSFQRNPYGWNDSLQNHYFRYPAIVPPMPWIDSVKPLKPIIDVKAGDNYSDFFSIHLRQAVDARPIRSYIVYRFASGDTLFDKNDVLNIYRIIPADSLSSIDIPNIEALDNRIAVSCLDRNNNESELVFIKQN